MLPVRDGVLSEDEPVRRRLLLHASHSIRCLADNQAEHEAGVTSALSVMLASILSESMTAVSITHLPRGVSWRPRAGCSSRREHADDRRHRGWPLIIEIHKSAKVTSPMWSLWPGIPRDTRSQ